MRSIGNRETWSLNQKLCSCQDARASAGPVRRKKRTTKRADRSEGDEKKLTISGGYDEGVPPVPIPNTEVKPFSADGTWLVTARESRSPPDPIFLSSSMAEHSAVNRRVVGSSPTWGAKEA